MRKKSEVFKRGAGLLWGAVFIVCGLGAKNLGAQIRVVSTTRDLASIAQEIGGKHVKVQSLAKGSDDIHYLSARPDYLLKLNRAQLLLFVGADLEIGWLPLLINKSRNTKIQAGGSGHCDISKAISLLGKKKGEITRQMGDLHPEGNPHYWPDPLNGVRIAKRITDCLSRIDHKRQALYKKNYQSFRAKTVALTKRLLKKMKAHFGKGIIAYHDEFIYFTKRFRLTTVAYIEEKPGVSPSPSRINFITELARQKKVKLILVGPWSDMGAAQSIARRSGVNILVFPSQTQSTKGTETYLKMIEKCVSLISEALSKK